MEELIRFNNLSVRYQVRDGFLSAVNNLSFSIKKGEIFALVGESGCGKSTVAFTTMGLLEGNEKLDGEILFKGNDLLKLSSEELTKIRGKEIGMIFQNPLDSLNPVYTSGHQVAEAIRIDKINKIESRKRAIDLFKEVRIPEAESRFDSYPHELSGGMRQRVMIAMMLSRSPDLLIADEPTTALDVTVEAQVLQLMRDLSTQLNSAILMITHNFGIVAEIADKVGIMYAGELVEVGPVEKIFHEPKHPYSIALMESLPRTTKKERRIRTIEGNVPRIVGDFKGCRFANRCPKCMDICTVESPRETIISDEHYMRCHLGGRK